MREKYNLVRLVAFWRSNPRDFINQITPFIKEPFEQATNFNVFLNRAIKEYEGQRVEFARMDVDPRLAKFFNNIRFMGDLNRFMERDKGAGTKVARFMVGKIYEQDPKRVRRSKEYKRRVEISKLKSARKRAIANRKKDEITRLNRLIIQKRRER